MTIDYLGVAAAAEHLGLSRKTVEGQIERGTFAKPDATIGRVRGWLPATLDAWQAQRPGQGARTDLTAAKRAERRRAKSD